MLSKPERTLTVAQPLAALRLTITPAEMGKLFSASLAEVLHVMKAQGAAPAGPCFAHHLRRPTDTFDFELGFPVTSRITASGKVYPAERPAQQAIHAIYTGPYQGLAQAWGEFQAWIDDHEYKYTSDFWETYLTDPGQNADPATWQTELLRPLA